MAGEINVVTGAFGFSGRHITQRLLAMGKEVRTLTGRSPSDNPFGDKVKTFPFDFDNPSKLAENLSGASTLYNTYWVRFAYGGVSYDRAVENSKILFKAAEEAGLRRIVHVSITNPALDSPFPYFRGKAALEETIRRSKLSYAILRPTVLFGDEGILINNIAWLLRRFPVFPVFGKGDYKIQPISIEDLADLAVENGQKEENLVIDAVGPEIFTFNEMVKLIGGKINRKPLILPFPPGIALFLSRIVGWLVGDVVVTRDEMEGLMANLLVSKEKPTGKATLEEWLEINADGIGKKYFSEIARNFGKKKDFSRLWRI